MNANIDEYKSKLMVVEQALLVTQSQSEINDLLSLKDNLIELIALTSTSETTPEIEENKYGLDRFLREISKKTCGNVECLDEEEKVEQLKDKCEKILGEKCSAPYRHTWGAVIYYNAIISEIESISRDNYNTKIKFKVLFINPTLREMLPCKYYLEGNCRFEEKNCYFSHGESVFASDLKEYIVPDFARLSTNCIVLAKLASRIWSRGRVVQADFTEKKCRVRLEGTDKIQKEEDFEFQDLLPISQDEETSSDSCSDLETECKNRTSSITYSKMPSSLFTYDTTDRLGDWEKFTKGIGSKLMIKMGYIAGNGLGINGGGIITPVSAQIFPPRRSLDHCMVLRELANGDKDLFSVEKKLVKLKKKQSILNTKAYERECQRVDIFSFLNKSVLPDPNTVTSSIQKTQNRNSLQQYSTKSLNIKSIGIANDIKRKQQEIAAMKKSLIRNINCNIRSNLERQLHNKTQELRTLMNEKSFLSKEQAVRKTKEKLCVF